MFKLTREQAASLRSAFDASRPGPQIGLHVIRTGHGAFFVDRWPEPQVIVARCAASHVLVGDADALAPGDLRRCVDGFVEAPAPFVPHLVAEFASVTAWDLVIFERRADGEEAPAPAAPPRRRSPVRRLEAGDIHHVWGLHPDIGWISRSWGGPAGLAASGRAFGAFTRGRLGGSRLVAVACAFFVGDIYEDIGAVTDPVHRGHGLATACARAVCDDITAHGHRPSWTTWDTNAASIRVAEKLGFALNRRARRYEVRTTAPAEEGGGGGSAGGGAGG